MTKWSILTEIPLVLRISCVDLSEKKLDARTPVHNLNKSQFKNLVGILSNVFHTRPKSQCCLRLQTPRFRNLTLSNTSKKLMYIFEKSPKHTAKFLNGTLIIRKTQGPFEKKCTSQIDVRKYFQNSKLNQTFSEGGPKTILKNYYTLVSPCLKLKRCLCLKIPCVS